MEFTQFYKGRGGAGTGFSALLASSFEHSTSMPSAFLEMVTSFHSHWTETFSEETISSAPIFPLNLNHMEVEALPLTEMVNGVGVSHSD